MRPVFAQVQPRIRNSTSNMGIGTPSSHNRIQPILPCCRFNMLMTIPRPEMFVSVTDGRGKGFRQQIDASNPMQSGLSGGSGSEPHGSGGLDLRALRGEDRLRLRLRVVIARSQHGECSGEITEIHGAAE